MELKTTKTLELMEKCIHSFENIVKYIFFTADNLRGQRERCENL